MANLGAVLSDYERDQPKRATGGIYALAGFNYQLRLYIAHLAESLTSNGAAVESAGRVFLEALSDLAIEKDDDLICIQAKRTLTKGNLKDAAAEILAVDRFFEQRYPELRSRVRFQLVASRGDRSVTWEDLPASHPSYPTIEYLLEQNRLTQPRIEPDPGWRAITAVWNHLKDPYDFVRFALDRALTRINSLEDAHRIRDDICERFIKDRNSPEFAGQILAPQDFSPSVSPSDSLEIGREITLARVRDLQYMPRQHRRDALCERLIERFDLSQRDLQPAVRVLWIAGRSGVGKSVLLLQAVERLVVEGRRVLWLGGEAESLEPTLRAITETHEDLRPEFVVIDDLYDRDARTRLDLARLGAFIDEAGRQTWPLIVTCGPAEFADAFEEDSRYRGFELHRETVQSVAADEAREIAAWYRQRTGREPAGGPAFEQAHEADGGLFISLAVELAHGDLREFALKFAARVRINGLDNALCLPLALNRLYLRAPYNWLSDADREKLTTLNIEGDFKLLEPGQAGQVVRLTHPHLGDALYRALRKPANSQAYANDLITIFERALREKNGGLVSQLLRLFSAPHHGLTAERLMIVDEVRLAVGCAQAAKADIGGWDIDTAADIATSWACWASMRPEIEACLGGDLFEAAVRSLDGALKVWSSCWCRLAACTPHSLALQAWAADHLSNDNFIVHPRWSLVWEQCLESATDQELWHDIGLRWIQRHLRRPDWHFVWKKLLPSVSNANWDSDAALTLGLRRLRAESDGPDWAYVMQDLFSFTEGHRDKAYEIAILGHSWLTGREDRSEWSYVWQSLLGKAELLPQAAPIDELLMRGYNWLAGREDRAEWSYVWRALQKRADQLPETIVFSGLIAQGICWLNGREDRAEWSHVWRNLQSKCEHLPSETSLEELLTQGHSWLSGREDRAEWTHVWKALLDQVAHLPAGSTLQELIQQGYSWMAGREDRAEWSYVWRALIQKTEYLPSLVPYVDLLVEGYVWAGEHQHRPEWTFVWQALLDNANFLPESAPIGPLLDQGYSWLSVHEDRPEWPFVWTALLNQTERLPSSVTVSKLLELGCLWLEGRTNQTNWQYVWRTLLEKAEELPESAPLQLLLLQGYNWLCQREDGDEWGFICEALLDHGFNDAEFLEVAAHRLSRTTTEKPWAIIAAKFLAAAPQHPASSGFAVLLTQRVDAFPNSNQWSKISHLTELFSELRCATDPAIRCFCQAFLNRRQAPSWALARELMSAQSAVRGTVTQVRGAAASVELELGLLAWWSNYSSSTNGVVGVTRDFYIQLISLEKDYVRVSHVPRQELDIGSIYDGEVIGQSDYGLFVVVGQSTGLIHRSRCSNLQELQASYPKGSSIRVRVMKKAEKGLELTYADDEIADMKDAFLIAVGDEFDGVVRNVVDFGLFIDIDDCRCGLLHRSNLPLGLDLHSAFSKGQAIRVKVSDVRNDGKISFTPLVVD